MSKKKNDCQACLNTGILSASLVRGDKKTISVVVCANHYSKETAEKNILRMSEASGLSVSVIEAKKPNDTPRD